MAGAVHELSSRDFLWIVDCGCSVSNFYINDPFKTHFANVPQHPHRLSSSSLLLYSIEMPLYLISPESNQLPF